MTRHSDENTDSPSDNGAERPGAGEENLSDLPVRMNLEQIIDMTGQLEHLNELIILHLEKAGGFTCTESYFITVQPVLDQLEGDIRFRYRSGMSAQQITLIVQDWIDQQIAVAKKSL